MRRLLKSLICYAALPGLCLATATIASAQPADLPIPPATTDQFPPGVHILHLPRGAVYADDKGHVLYGMDMRVLLRDGSDPAQHCVGPCAKDWVPLLAPAGSQPNVAFPAGFGERRTNAPRAAGPGPVMPTANAVVPDWTIISGPQGPQWVYKHWHMVFVRRGAAAGSTAFDGVDDRTWNTLKFVPPIPTITGPANVQTLVIKGNYLLANKDGRVLFTGSCGKPCAWQPLGAGMASAGIGDWSVSTAGDAPQWLWHGKPVYVSQEDDPKQVPAAADVLRP